MSFRVGGLGAVGHAANQGTDLADDLGVIQGQRRVRLRMRRLDLQGAVQALANLAGQFVKNFEKYASGANAEILAAAPKV